MGERKGVYQMYSANRDRHKPVILSRLSHIPISHLSPLSPTPTNQMRRPGYTAIPPSSCPILKVINPTIEVLCPTVEVLHADLPCSTPSDGDGWWAVHDGARGALDGKAMAVYLPLADVPQWPIPHCQS